MQSKKRLISIRVDESIIEWFKKSGKYQTAIREHLHKHVESSRLKEARTLGRAQELFNRFYSQCFWHYKSDLEINSSNLSLVIEGLRKYGGNEGYKIADELQRNYAPN